MFARSAPSFGASLSFQAPDVCPSEAAVIEAIEAERGRPLAEDADVSFAAVVVSEGAETWRLTVVTTPTGDVPAPSRTLRARDCADLVTALARVVSLVLGPPREAREPSSAEPEPERPAPDVHVAAPARPAPSTALEMDTLPPRLRAEAHERLVLIALFAELDTASLGGVTVGGRLESGVQWGDIAELRAGFAYTPTQSMERDVGGTKKGAAFRLLDASVLGCAAVSPSGMRVPFCAGLELGSLSAKGRGVSPPLSAAVPWLAARVDARLCLAVAPRVRLEFVGGLIAPLLRHRFYTAEAQVHEVPDLSARLAAGVEWSI